jgi:hypothetical protein
MLCYLMTGATLGLAVDEHPFNMATGGRWVSCGRLTLC